MTQQERGIIAHAVLWSLLLTVVVAFGQWG